jgi:hypothetical protein
MLYSKRLWRWCITFRITGFFGLFPSPGILDTQKNIQFRKLNLFPFSDEWERHLLCWVNELTPVTSQSVRPSIKKHQPRKAMSRPRFKPSTSQSITATPACSMQSMQILSHRKFGWGSMLQDLVTLFWPLWFSAVPKDYKIFTSRDRELPNLRWAWNSSLQVQQRTTKG